MAFNVNKFISHFDSHAGFARSSKFEVRISLPGPLMGMGTTEELALQCESAEIPGYTVNTFESKIFGAPTYVAGTPAFGDITLNFICAGDLWEKKFFDAWLDLIIPKSTYLVKYKQDYQTTVTIHQFSDYAAGNYVPGSDSQGTNLNRALTNNPTVQVVDSLLNNSLSKLNNITNTLSSFTQKNTSPQSSLNLKGSEIFSCKLVNAFPVTVSPLQLNWAADDVHKLSVVFKYDKWLNMQAPQPVNQPPTQRTPGLSVDTQRTTRGVVVPGK